MIARIVIWIALTTLLAVAALRWIKSIENSNWHNKDETIMPDIEIEWNNTITTATSSSSSVSKSRDTELSPVCGLKYRDGLHWEGSLPITRIVFLHMRKAGGTTIWSYLKDVAEKYGIIFESYEGMLPPLPKDRDPSTLFVTHIRDPTDRVISHYKYEMRWSCKSLTNKKEHFIPTENNTRTSFDHFIDTPNTPMKSVNLKGHLWECSHNCYAKWSTGLCWDEGPYDDNHYCWSLQDTNHSFLSEARHSLWNYNFIFVIEWLKNPNYVRSIETMFGTPGLSHRQTFMWCGAESAAANQQIPLVVTTEQYRAMEHFNQVDRILYDELTAGECHNDFQFPNQTISFASKNNGTAQIIINK